MNDMELQSWTSSSADYVMGTVRSKKLVSWLGIPESVLISIGLIKVESTCVSIVPLLLVDFDLTCSLSLFLRLLSLYF